jgi:hypothetical protein
MAITDWCQCPGDGGCKLDAEWRCLQCSAALCKGCIEHHVCKEGDDERD